MNGFGSQLLKGTAIATLLAAGFVPSAKANIAMTEPSQFGSCGDAVSVSQGWGSPGISCFITPYQGSVAAYGLDVTFFGVGPIRRGSVTTGNNASCSGDSYGGTTFCTIDPLDIWEAFQLGPDTLAFRAQDSSFYLSPDQEYFVNVFFSGPDDPPSFTGTWITNFSPNPTAAPEPASMLLFGTGLLGLAALRRRKRA